MRTFGERVRAWQGVSARERWGILLVLFCEAAVLIVLCGSLFVLRPPTDPFYDGGDPDALLLALREAGRGLPENDLRRHRLEVLATALLREWSLEEVLVTHTRRASSAQVLLTGYYEPTVLASRSRDERFRHPLYTRPPAAIAGASRREIDEGALGGHGLELFWLEDPVESFFLHVQGSGRLQFSDGTTARVGYAGNNGYAYHSIGRELVKRGILPQRKATAPAIKSWLRSHPQSAWEILQTNPRYIYFRELFLSDDLGPPGSLGVPLVPFRSVATDPTITPAGTVGLLRAPMPDGSELHRTVIAMDSGAAIRGPSRVDLFVGVGEEAEKLAGNLRARARIDWLH